MFSVTIPIECQHWVVDWKFFQAAEVLEHDELRQRTAGKIPRSAVVAHLMEEFQLKLAMDARNTRGGDHKHKLCCMSHP